MLWNGDSFAQAVEPVYDLGKALVAGEAPDFEAYRARCNASIQVGTVVIGQHRVWQRGRDDERDQWEERNHRQRGRYRHVTDPGPGKLAHVTQIVRGGACVFEWVRTQKFWRRDDNQEHQRHFATRLRVPRQDLFNVEAYRAGDFRPFFADPRTRENYLQWAPLLLEAEEYAAGHRQVRPMETMPPKRPRTVGGNWDYQERKRKRSLVGLAFALRRDCRMKSGTVHKKGSLWRIREYAGRRDGFYVDGINPDGTFDTKNDRSISGLDERDFTWRPDIPRVPASSVAEIMIWRPWRPWRPST